MKKFVLNTKSESGDYYTYFIEHPKEPTKEELELFLKEYACDKDDEDGQVYEYVQDIYEIEDKKFLKIPN